MGALDLWGTTFNSVGWFIPPYVQCGEIGRVAARIHAAGISYSQDELEQDAAPFYGPGALAPMVLHRYPQIPIINAYKETIAEAVEAHFLGLHHIAVGGLIPVVEGAARQLGAQRNLSSKSMRDVFVDLADACKREAKARNIGAVDEIESMMDAFQNFATKFLYVDSGLYPLVDKTNRHGITHGAYKDADYGRPLNFYKTISAVDILAFISGFRAPVSWMAPAPSRDSLTLSRRYILLTQLAQRRHPGVTLHASGRAILA